MCFFKSEVERYIELMEHYAATFDTITAEMDLMKEKFSELIGRDSALKSIGLGHSHELGLQLMQYSQKDAMPSAFTKQELTEMRWYQRLLSAYGSDTTYHRYYENGFDYFPTHIVTAGEPDKFKLLRWGLIPFFVKEKDKAMVLRTQTLNCISEEMYDKPSFRDAAKNAQRCLIPVTGFYEWRWLDEQGTVKVPYYVTFRDQKIRSIAGLYSHWKDPATGEYYNSYTVLTCPANNILEYVHNNKKRMPVFIDQENEKDWLNRDLKKDDVLDLCKPFTDPAMRAYTISKLLTTRNVDINVPEVLAPFNYNTAIQEAHQFLLNGEKKKALLAFKDALNADKAKEEHLQLAAGQEVLTELSLK
ncbi:MAG TPA: SOS response-associated peptidase [Chryseolinea sp.]|nr:SOS response-associated peptidase [Chryseolinea sp.]